MNDSLRSNCDVGQRFRSRAVQASVLASAVALTLVCGTAAASDPGLTPEQKLGKNLFFDTSLSTPAGQACASCHTQPTGFTFPNSDINDHLGVAPGVIPGRFGFRAVPQISYAAFGDAGPVHHNHQIELYVGGLFWDGRADDLVGQALMPFLNPNEMNNLTHNVGDPAIVVAAVQGGPFATDMREVYGQTVFSQSTMSVYNKIAKAISEYEKSREVSPFSSKYDAWRAGRAQLTPQEMHGLQLMTGSYTGRFDGAAFPVFAHCGDCHMTPQIPAAGSPDLFTNTCYQNLGVPRNPDNPFYHQTNREENPVGYNPLGEAFVDYGLGGVWYPRMGLPAGNIGEGSDGRGDFLGINGIFKAPSLRNVDKRPYPTFIKAYMHNGVFKNLKDVVHFYNTRNLTTEPGEVINFEDEDPYANLIGVPLWPRPEYASAETLVNAPGELGTLPGNGPGGESGAQVGNLGITDEEEDAIVAFLKCLSDGYFDPSLGEGCLNILSQPVGQKTCLGGSCAFTVAPDRSAHVTYQWRHNGVAMPGEHSPQMWIVSPSPSDAGEYDCVLTAPCGSLISNSATLTICAGDFNCDGQTDLMDYLDFVDAFSQDDIVTADINHDDVLDFFDYLDFVNRFNDGC